ncbi:hypothetical protein PsorP6_004280 [Peronosclerospora sorghi]|uniref:Uncharacterized protein n=1 Tax=Peronosclerospora sorghi TaxID=230839 RepID=A0ACC0VIM6_9STRA|nr:hypothetical protein PsorP6_004280 [Peronosclerospora sorghi]
MHLKDTEVSALLGCYQTARLELEAKQASVTTTASATTSSSSRGGDQEATPSRHQNEDIQPELADESDDSDGSRIQPPPSSKRLRVSKAANNDIRQVILEMEKQRQNFELSLERMRDKEPMECEARQEAVEERRRQEDQAAE